MLSFITLGCDADEETLTDLTTGSDAATGAGDEAATTEAGDEAGPCDFAMSDGNNVVPDDFTWTEGNLAEDSDELCPSAEDFIEATNALNNEAPDDEDKEEGGEDESDCDPVVDEGANLCTLVFSCKVFDGSFMIETDGSVTLSFTATMDGLDADGGYEPIFCEYDIYGTIAIE